ncbi:Saccharopine dehydrogenase [Fusarium tjaetaba]|uniref:Saccharopine dehydrogenase [NAD(+), L-lysine-forming] n=1 Tax=Fusarium tjaetaba TaxID=1567544 RepID=A0A8H5RKG2_9HYPO|nr:Saccharopine dehydrogenase [Fusarium tjaetaba]KAF5636386.1 Saccharopine dehydrogenase [Fusarium tjaetaba]
MFGWGSVTIAMAFARTYEHMIGLIILMGFLESGFAPGVLLLLSSWYKSEEQSKRFAAYISAAILSGAFGGLLAGSITSGLDGAHGKAGWRWLFVVEGAATMGVAVIAYFILPDFPANTSRLKFSQEEIDLAIRRLQHDRPQVHTEDEEKLGHWQAFKLSMTNWRTWLFVVGYMAIVGSSTLSYFYLSYFYLTLVKGLGYEFTAAQYMTIPIFGVAFVVTALTGSFADKNSKWRGVILCAWMSVAMLCAVIICVVYNFKARYALLVIDAKEALSKRQIKGSGKMRLLSPATAKALLDAGYTVRVEESPDRIYKIDEFRDVGADIVPAGSWVNAPKEDIILGLKEIEANGTPLPHTYIHFAHVFKKQSGWATELSRFANADGLLYDLEFLTDEDGRRVAAFGYWAGYAGTALALLSWAHQLLNPGVPQGPVPVVDSASALTELVKGKVDAARSANHGALPRLIVIGALGRCGKGAIAAAEAIGVSDILKWDIAETSKGGPFTEVASSDIFVNCVYLGSHKIPPFTTFEALSAPDRRLRVICDVSCDPNSENNPIPVYSSYSSFENPTVPASEHIDGPELRIIAIDHLPTMVARESSDEYSSLLLPSLLTLDRRDTEGVWQRAERIFRDRVAELP